MVNNKEGSDAFFTSLYMNDDQLNQIWKNVLGEMETHISPVVFKTWFKNSRLLGITGSQAEIGVTNRATVNFLQKFTEGQLKNSLSNFAGNYIQSITYSVVATAKPAKKDAVPVVDQQLFADPPVRQNNAVSAHSLPSNLNPKYVFSNFIVGNRNRLAYAAAKAVADQPGVMYNPLYLYGGVGLGKTHLMQAVGNEIIRRDPTKQVLYVSCEGFTNDYVASIQRNRPDDFKRKYRSVDVFLVDDIQFMAGKDGTQEEFFHTFNALYQTNKQIIITSDKIPSEIKDLEERLSSRFSSGMIADIQPPDIETRQAILQAKCIERNILLPQEGLAYIATQIESNIRELEGALTTVIGRLEGKSNPTLEEIRQALSGLTVNQPHKKTSFDILSNIVCEQFSVSMDDLRGPCRQKELVRPRQVLMYLLKHELGMTFPSIGRELGGRDHTTAMHAVDKIEKEMKKSNDLLQELSSIKERFYSARA